MPATSKKLEIVYKSTIARYRPIALAAFIVAAFIAGHAIWDLALHPHYATSRIQAYFRFPIALFIVGAALFIYYDNKGRVIKLGPTSLTYEKGPQQFGILYSQLKVIGPKTGVKRNRSMTLSDGQHTVKVEEFFFPKGFDALLNDLRERTKVLDEHTLD